MEIPLLRDIVIIFSVSIVVLYLCHQIKIPVIVGFLLTGILIGPHGLGFVKSVHEVEVLAEIGIVLLLFTIGIEFSFQKLLQVKKAVLIGGSLQVFGTLLAVAAIVSQVENSLGEGIFFGALLALSSTAIVLKTLQERAEIDSSYGRMSLAILIFQDLIIVPMIIFTPFLAGDTSGGNASPLWLIGKGLALVAIIALSSIFLVPKALHQIVRTRSKELFLLSIVSICMVVAWFTSLAGLSLGLGAFLAGLIISESEYSHQALDGILPFKDVFSSFFFISVGMLLDIRFLFQEPWLILALVAGVLVLKTLVAGVATLLLGASLRVAILTGLSLNQVGEFSFILSKSGLKFGLLDDDNYQLFLAVSILTMGVTPFIISAAHRIADTVNKLPLPKRLKSGVHPISKTREEAKKRVLHDHVIIVGFGVNGRNLARAVRSVGILYTIIEGNPDTVRKERAKGEPIYYGDATQEAVLRDAHIHSARILVIAISDPAATERITQLARQLNSGLHIIVRTRFVEEIKELQQLGADEVIPEEFETSVEIFTLVLIKYLVPRDDIELIVNQIRSENYRMFRSLAARSSSLDDLKPHLPDIEINSLRIGESSPAAGKTLAELELRKKYGITLLAIRRDSQTLANPKADTPIMTGDVLILLGSLADMKQAEEFLRGSP
jgi:CPA2 family monovalent cation:H+ antiporter-2